MILTGLRSGTCGSRGMRPSVQVPGWVLIDSSREELELEKEMPLLCQVDSVAANGGRLRRGGLAVNGGANLGRCVRDHGLHSEQKLLIPSMVSLAE